MRTTLSIDDEVLEAAKVRARQRGVSLGSVVEAALRRSLSTEDAGDVPPIPVFTGGTGPRRGVVLTSNRAMAELLDEDVPLDRRR